VCSGRLLLLGPVEAGLNLAIYALRPVGERSRGTCPADPLRPIGDLRTTRFCGRLRRVGFGGRGSRADRRRSRVISLVVKI